MNEVTEKVPSWFLEKFSFDPNKVFFVGCEREMFTCDKQGNIKPYAERALKILDDKDFGYELSACQIEAHIGPVQIEDFIRKAFVQQTKTNLAMAKNDMTVSFDTVASEDMPLDVYPDPTGRYQRITANMPREVLLAACRVTGTHIHIGMPNLEKAIQVYNNVLNYYDTLLKMGNLTCGKRLSIYSIMASDFVPRKYKNQKDFFNYYEKMGYQNDPRKCWHLIRISVHGTIEFRLFDNTANLELIKHWVDVCHNLCLNSA